MEWKGEFCAINQSLKSLAPVHTEPGTNNYRRRVGSPGSPEEELKDGARLRNCFPAFFFFFLPTLYTYCTRLQYLAGYLKNKYGGSTNKLFQHQTVGEVHSRTSSRTSPNPRRGKPWEGGSRLFQVPLDRRRDVVNALAVAQWHQ